MNTPRTITIEPVLNGYCCRVGCQIVVFESRSTLLTCLQKYLESPDSYEKLFIDSALHPDMARNPVLRDPPPSLTSLINRAIEARPPEPCAPCPPEQSTGGCCEARTTATDQTATRRR